MRHLDRKSAERLGQSLATGILRTKANRNQTLEVLGCQGHVGGPAQRAFECGK